MATPDMTDASGRKDQVEGREPGVRGWFQPPTPPPAADTRSDEKPDTAEVGDPEATAVFPRLLASERLAGDSEPAGPDLASVTRPAERSSDDELPTAIQAPPAAGAPEPTPRGRPADITRPQLILD